MKEFKWLWILFIAVVVIQAGLAVTIYMNLDTWANRGTFGDMFGAVNTLFSGLAFAGLIFANLTQSKELSLQREELQLQRDELKLTRNELGKAATAQEEQARLMVHSARITAVSNRLNAEAMLVSNSKGIPGSGTEHDMNVLKNTFDELQSLIEKDV
jgi:hypothetical protein